MLKELLKFKPKDFTDLIAIIIIIGCFYLISMGIDSTVTAVLVSVASYYFGHNR